MQREEERTTPAGAHRAAGPTQELTFEVHQRGITLRVAVQVLAADPPVSLDGDEACAEAGYGHGV